MEYQPEIGVQVSVDQLRKTIEACEFASSSMIRILHSLQASGQVAQQWADDAVSHDIAGHYIEQLWSGGSCTYVALKRYHQELLSTIDALRGTLAEYSNFDGTTAASMERL